MNDDLHDDRDENLVDGVLDADTTGMVQSQVDITLAQIEENALDADDAAAPEPYDEVIGDSRAPG